MGASIRRAGIDLSVNIKLNQQSVQRARRVLQRQLGTLNLTIGAVTGGVAGGAAVATTRGFGKIQSGATRAQRSVGKLKNEISETRDELRDFGLQSGLAIRRFLAFTIPAAVIFGSFALARRGIRDAISFEREMIRVAQVTQKTLRGLRPLQNTIGQLSASLGVASEDLARVSVILGQSGLAFQEIQTVLRTLALTELAPTFESIESTTEGAVAILAQFGDQIKTLNQTGIQVRGVDRLASDLGEINALAKEFAVESGDLIFAIRRAGGAFQAAGGTLTELLALFTAVRSTTRESAQTIATGFRTIFTRLQRPRTIDFMRQLNIELTTLKGNEEVFVGAFEAVRRISSALAELPQGSLTRARVVEQLGGFRQVAKVIPLLEQFNKAERARQVALEGQLSLEEDRKIALQALSIQLARVREQFTLLFRDILQDKSVQAFARTVLTLTQNLLELTRALVPLVPLLGTLGLVFAATRIPRLLSGQFQSLARRSTVFLEFQKRGIPSPSQTALQTGGQVPGQGNTDSVLAALTPGEFVINKKSAQAIGGDALSRLNKFNRGGFVRRIKKFQGGGFVPEETGITNVPGFRLPQQAQKLTGVFDKLERASEKYLNVIERPRGGLLATERQRARVGTRGRRVGPGVAAFDLPLSQDPFGTRSVRQIRMGQRATNFRRAQQIIQSERGLNRDLRRSRSEARASALRRGLTPSRESFRGLGPSQPVRPFQVGPSRQLVGVGRARAGRISPGTVIPSQRALQANNLRQTFGLPARTVAGVGNLQPTTRGGGGFLRRTGKGFLSRGRGLVGRNPAITAILASAALDIGTRQFLGEPGEIRTDETGFATVARRGRGQLGSLARGGGIGAITGASFGSLAGPRGKIIGGILGGLAGLTNSLSETSREIEQLNIAATITNFDNALKDLTKSGSLSEQNRQNLLRGVETVGQTRRELTSEGTGFFGGVANLGFGGAVSATGNLITGGLIGTSAEQQVEQRLQDFNSSLKSEVPKLENAVKTLALAAETRQEALIGNDGLGLKLLAEISNITGKSITELKEDLIDIPRSIKDVQEAYAENIRVVENFFDRLSNLSNAIDRAADSSRIFESRAAGLQDFLSGGVGGANLVGAGSVFGGFGRVDPARFESELGRFTQAFGPAGDKIFDVGTQLDQIARILPNTLRNLSAEFRQAPVGGEELLGAGVVPIGQDLAAAIEKQITDLDPVISAVLETSGDNLARTFSEFADRIEQEGAERLSDDILRAFNPLLETLQKFQREFETRLNDLVNTFARAAQRQVEIDNQRFTAEETRIRAEQEFRRITGQRPNTRQFEQEFRRQQEFLTGQQDIGTDPTAIANQIRALQQQIQIQRQRVAAEVPDSEEQKKQLNELEATQTALARFKEALSNLAGSTLDLESAQQKLAEAQERQAAVNRTRDVLLFGSQAQQQQIARGAGVFRRFQEFTQQQDAAIGQPINARDLRREAQTLTEQERESLRGQTQGEREEFLRERIQRRRGRGATQQFFAGLSDEERSALEAFIGTRTQREQEEFKREAGQGLGLPQNIASQSAEDVRDIRRRQAQAQEEIAGLDQENLNEFRDEVKNAFNIFIENFKKIANEDLNQIVTGFKESTTQFGDNITNMKDVVDLFSEDIDKFVEVMEGFDPEITLQGQQNVNVTINGLEAFRQMEPTIKDWIQDLIVQNLNQSLVPNTEGGSRLDAQQIGGRRGDR